MASQAQIGSANALGPRRRADGKPPGKASAGDAASVGLTDALPPPTGALPGGPPGEAWPSVVDKAGVAGRSDIGGPAIGCPRGASPMAARYIAPATLGWGPVIGPMSRGLPLPPPPPAQGYQAYQVTRCTMATF